MSQTNIGDVALTCPIIDILHRDFPQAKIDVVTGPKAVSLFADHPDLGIKVFDKRAPLRKKWAWFLDLWQAHYDCVVDLRRTMLPLLLRPRYATPVLFGKFSAKHKKAIHLNRLRQVYDFGTPTAKQYAVVTTPEDEKFFAQAVAPALQGRQFIVIAPGAGDCAKRWHTEGFAAVADHLAASHKIVFVGDRQDAEIVDDIQARMKAPSVSLAGKIHLRQLALVLKKCLWALAHDSGVMHLACYLNVPVVALWGPTDIHRYAPWSAKSVIVRRNEQCPRCRHPKAYARHNCMSFITVEDVIDATTNF